MTRVVLIESFGVVGLIIIQIKC